MPFRALQSYNVDSSDASDSSATGWYLVSWGTFSLGSNRQLKEKGAVQFSCYVIISHVAALDFALYARKTLNLGVARLEVSH